MIAILLLLGIILLTCYFVRKNEARNQYVHSNSEAVATIAFDDLLLDNVGQLFKRHAPDTEASKLDWLDMKNWWRAGVHIPAQIHFFSMKDKPLTFFTIQKITNVEKWKAFLKEQHIDSITHISPHVSVLYDDKFLLIGLTAFPQSLNTEIQAIWDRKDEWIYVRDLSFPSFINQNVHHFSYRHTDGTFQLFADKSGNEISLNGEWHLTTALPPNLQMRQRETSNAFIWLQSSLPIAETPFILKTLSIFSTIEPDRCAANTYSYTDLLVSSESTLQHDTVIMYDYDINFNRIEKTEIQEITVPIIENTWKGNQQFATSLPNKLFYRFHKQMTDSLVLLSTKTDTELPSSFVTAPGPFYVTVDFRHLPPSWKRGRLHTLQEQGLQINIKTSVIDENRLGITGTISGYKHPVQHGRLLQNQKQHNGH